MVGVCDRNHANRISQLKVDVSSRDATGCDGSSGKCQDNRKETGLCRKESYVGITNILCIPVVYELYVQVQTPDPPTRHLLPTVFEQTYRERRPFLQEKLGRSTRLHTHGTRGVFSNLQTFNSHCIYAQGITPRRDKTAVDSEAKTDLLG